MGLQGLLFISLLLFSFPTSEADPGSYRRRNYPAKSAVLNGKENTVEELASDEVTASDLELVNVANYGAKGDGSDATEAFNNGWKKVCSSSSSAALMVPANENYLLKPIIFSGPCRSNVSVMIKGTLQASSDQSDWDGADGRHWILFAGINNLHVAGGGTINGNGQIWWKNSCKINKSLPCKDAPTAITFYSTSNLVVENLKVTNSQQIHVQFEKCTNVRASHLTINSPSNSPNTDGIHITSTRDINIDHCNIGTGDDCISIVNGAQTVKAMNIACGPGHGISIGSLGAQNSEDHVSDVTIDTAQLTGTTSGLRIKTWQGGKGYARHIRFQNVNMKNVQNPIVIDQNYCDSEKPCYEQKSAVLVSDVTYKNIKGTIASDTKIDFKCSKSVPCQEITLEDINLVKADGGITKSSCSNVRWSQKGVLSPSTCA
ncbi:uncharacterized protein A4U43_C10F860 [Asparagus officinalis]|uniref:endo-polygalacturonase n=1 Tax=Asparagus officinalis TaxID=4686 RepID=A0A5P1E2W0_ASPOF|nr:polygalacturonase-like [Asparagus officinalis]ONK55775.1 uncharacterized protein A4U43_C10F860 [Asparagus officinalis]